ncbi:MAG: hypothetical protein MRJ65_15960 [Candidatus Brocadiaceae bacterium]|nr:hypothetical protein [Candidatus Brocadiaceae bacterium]
MVKIYSIMKGFLPFLFMLCCTQKIYAHEGHDHWTYAPVCIKKSTFVHLQSVLKAYEEVYHLLASKESDGIEASAKKIMEAAQEGIQTERKGDGCYMMEHVFLGARELQRAETIQDAREAFASITSELMPFFISWPNQLKLNAVKLYRCKDDGYSWLQPEDSVLVCPYTSDELTSCKHIEEVKPNHK